MARNRILIVYAWAALTIAALAVGRCCDRALFWTLLVLGLSCYGIYLLLERGERQHEEAAQRAWCAEISCFAESLDLAGYGITSLEELARYHDSSGRAAVLDALRRLPAGNRSLLAAARSVEPNAAWD